MSDRSKPLRSKRKRKAAASLKRMREAIAALPDAAVILDRNDRVEWSNPAAADLLGIEWPAASHRPVTEQLTQPAFLNYLKERDFDQALEIDSATGNGRRLSIQITAFSKARLRLLVARDVTAHYNLNRVRKDFIANISHELRTPLTVMAGFLETMVEDADYCPDWARSVELMNQQALRMQALVDDLLLLSKLEMDSTSESEEIAVAALLQTIVDDALTISGDRRHQIQLTADPDLHLLGNARELRSAWSNLIVNAVHYTPAGGHIEVNWSRRDDEAIFSVKDNGEGIPAKHLPRLTERFYRVDKHRSRRVGGTGLGLAIVKHALARHGSQLEIYSLEGHGSLFSCRFNKQRLILG